MDDGRKPEREVIDVKELNLDSFLDELSMGVYFVVPEGKGVWRFTYVNSALAKILGYEREELLGKNSIDVIHPDYREVVIKNAEKRFQEGVAPEKYRILAIRKDGSERLVSLMPHLVRRGGKYYIYGLVEDFTEMERLNQLYRLFRDALGRSEVGVLASEGDFKISRASVGAAKILGFDDPEEMKGLSMSSVFNIKGSGGDTHASEGDERLLHLLRGEKLEETPTTPLFWRGELIHHDKTSGEDRFLIMEVTAFPGMGGKTYMLIMFMDETPLIREKRRADAYLDIIVHDMANFLTPVYGYLDFIELTYPLQERMKRDLKRIRLNLQKITRLLDSARLLSAIEGGCLPLESSSAPEVVQEVLKELLEDENLQDWKWTTDVEDSPLPSAEIFVRALGDVLSQIIEDLPQHPGEIKIKGLKNGIYYRLKVEFPSERGLESYYSLFFRRFESLEVDKRTTGLWFSVARDLLKCVGGGLHLDMLQEGRFRVEIRYPLAIPTERAGELSTREPIL